jgi:RND family efflux transporter MFP subunit
MTAPLTACCRSRAEVLSKLGHTSASRSLVRRPCDSTIGNFLGRVRSGMATRMNTAIAPLVFVGAFSNVALAAAGESTAGRSFDCLISANQLIEIRSPVSGLLDSVPFKRGSVVRKGAVVATLESSAERSAAVVAKYRSEMSGAAESGVARVDLLGKKFERRRDLASGKAISIQDRDDADLDRRLAAAELKQARENKELARLEWQHAVDLLNLRSIKSPFNGIVVDQYLYPGELVDPNDPKRVILKLAEVDRLRVEVILPVSLFGAIKVGEAAEVIPEAPIGGRYATTVNHVDRIVDSASGTFGVRLELPNPQMRVAPGVKCKVSFKG